jgi:alkylated DNA repair dioxygenase AlkB
MNQIQPDLFPASPALPEGFRYWPDFLSADEERNLVERFATLPFKEFEFRGYRGNRRVLSFGWQYDFNQMELQRTDDMPAFLLPLRERAARFANLEASDLQHVLLTEYAPGAGIGWHKDKPVFAEVVGISLGSPCAFRFRRKSGRTWEGAPWSLRRALHTCCRAPPARNGSTAFRPWTVCATRSRSGISDPPPPLDGRVSEPGDGPGFRDPRLLESGCKPGAPSPSRRSAPGDAR